LLLGQDHHAERSDDTGDIEVLPRPEPLPD